MEASKKNFRYRLGLDLGTHSIGWAILELDSENRPCDLKRMGSRIFSDGRTPKDGTSLAVSRRLARGARRRRDRYIQRRTKLLNALVRMGLFPDDLVERKKLETRNPYELRAKAAKGPVHPFELGRALFHLNQRRGFKSNRKTQTKDEMKNIGPKIEGLRQELQLKTLGEYLWERQVQGLPVRAKKEVNLYPARDMLEEEFRKIRETQEPHQNLSPNDWDGLYTIIFHQRDLREVQPGWCWVYSDEPRAPRALPSFFKFTIAQNLHNLELIFLNRKREKRKLTGEQWKKLWELLQSQKSMKFSAIPKKLGIDEPVEFNLETERRSELKGNETSCLLSQNKYFGKSWFEFSDEEQDSIVEELLKIENPDAVKAKAVAEWKRSEEQAQNLADLVPEDFPKGYARFSKKALHELVEVMRDQGLAYHEAMEEMGKHHSMNDPEPNWDVLDYYGKLLPEAVVGRTPEAPEKDEAKHYGRIPNPTVHIGLNQLRHVVNAIIKQYGKPSEIVLELARELKQTYEQKSAIQKIQKKNQDDNKRIDKELERLGQSKNRENRIKYKLWEELSPDPNDRHCPFSGKRIALENLFTPAIEVEHILPFAETLDDSINNKTICFAEANRDKGKKAPWEAFAKPGSPYPFEKILERAQHLPPGKRWRFDPDAMERFRDEKEFLGRALNDTAYLSRIARKYLAHICHRDRVWVVPGRLTAFLRYQWGLDAVLGKKGLKNRNDHRHHAVDAMVAAFTDRSLLTRIRRDNSGKISLQVSPPLGKSPEQFFNTVKTRVNEIIVSHRPDHSIKARFHEDTVYGEVSPSRPEREEGFNVVYTKPLENLSEQEIHAVSDPGLREKLEAHLNGLTGKEFKDQLAAFKEREKIKRVRILKKENPLIRVRHTQTVWKPKTGKLETVEHEKCLVPGEIHHVAFWKMPDGKIEVVGNNFFEVNTKKPHERRPHRNAKLLMKIHKGDMLKLEVEGKEKIVKVTSLRPVNRQIGLVEHFEGGDLAKRQPKEKVQSFPTFNSLVTKNKARKIHVDPLGNIQDPGPVRS